MSYDYSAVIFANLITLVVARVQVAALFKLIELGLRHQNRSPNRANECEAIASFLTDSLK